jgi:putative transport protein
LLTLLHEPLFVLFSILALGYAIGQVKVYRISLGASGVLFAALVFGHYGLKVPKEVMDLGLLLFVYSVGIQSGPHFFRTFRKSGSQFLAIAAVTIGTAAAATIILARVFQIPFDLACGLFTGATTCTPALAAAIDVLPDRAANVSVAYGVAYPFSMIGMVLLMQFLPVLLRRPIRADEQRWRGEQEADQPKLLIKQYRVTNPNCEGVPLRALTNMHISEAVISRVRKGDAVLPATPDVVLELGDTVMTVGSRDELEKLRLLLGVETEVKMDLNSEIVAMDVEVTEPALVGKRMGDLKVWEHHGAVITRIKRQGMDLSATGSVRLDMGDILHAVGDRVAVEEFARLVDVDHKKVDETNMVPFLLGLAAGIGLGSIPVTLTSGVTVKLGMAGGAFIVSLLLGHFGRIGRFRLYYPQAAKNLARELGLMLFLAGAGTNAGSRFVSLIQEQGFTLFFTGAAVTLTAALAGVLFMHFFYRMNVLAIMGAIAACMTNPPALSAASSQTSTDLPTLSYASVYPVALISKILLVQFLVQVFRLLA